MATWIERGSLLGPQGEQGVQGDPGADGGTTPHAARHAVGGDDPVSPSSIGAASDSAVVHNTGAETVAGVKTFSSAPVVPTPGASGNPVRNDDTRLFNERTPLASLANVANGWLKLDGGTKVPQAYLPAIAITEFLGAVADQTEMLALTGQRGDWATRNDLGTNWQLIAEPSSTLGNWRELTYPAAPVSSVNGRTGAVSGLAEASALAGYQPLDSDLTTLAGLAPSDGTFVKRVSGAWAASTLAKGDVGLGNVDNTADTAKPVSTAQQTALDGKQTLNAALTDIVGLAPTDGDYLRRVAGHWSNVTAASLKTSLGLAKADVGLGSVDNTSDVAKPVSTATQTALDGKQGLNAALTDIVGLTSTDGDYLRRVSGHWSNITTASLKTSLSLAKADVGLGSVDNTSDVAKPVSTAQQTALDGKQPLDSDLTAIAGFNSAVAGAIASDGAGWVKKTYAQFKTALSLDNVTNTSDANKPVSTAQQTALDGKQSIDSDLTAIAALAPADGTFIKRASSAWTAATLTKSDVGLSNVDNTADTAKPVSTATQTALDSKQASDIDLTDIAALIPLNNDIIQRKSGSWVNRTLAQLASDLGLAAAYQPLDSDLTAIAALAPADGTFIKRASSSWIAATLVKSDVGLGNVDNTSDASKNSAVVTLNSKTIDGGTF